MNDKRRLKGLFQLTGKSKNMKIENPMFLRKLSMSYDNKKASNKTISLDVSEGSFPTQKGKVSLSDFLIVRRVGQGSSADIFAVKSRHSLKVFAMKKFDINKLVGQSDGFDDDKNERLEQILYEKELLSGLKHNFICNLHYAFKNATSCFLVLDFAAQGDLRSLIQSRKSAKRKQKYSFEKEGKPNIGSQFGSALFRRKPTSLQRVSSLTRKPKSSLLFEENEVKFYTRCVVEALKYLKSENVVHRDIKPDNLLIDQKGYLLLSDFGVSTKLTAENGYKCYLSSGTPSYLAPEVMNYTKNHEHSFPVDVFSLGMTLFELLCGKLPIDLLNVVKPWALSKDMFDETVRPRIKKLQARGVSKTLLSMIYDMIVFNPQERLDFEQLEAYSWLTKDVTEESHSQLLRMEVLSEDIPRGSFVDTQLEEERVDPDNFRSFASLEDFVPLATDNELALLDDFYYASEVA
eukprot:snap_masked-scaffold_1-processed-gene-19.34-mRNA-1 protein AED:0.37 eAED:0.37 QI:0/-1/0/1/-1/1/1/0/461